jgi:phage portal protein BeeE
VPTARGGSTKIMEGKIQPTGVVVVVVMMICSYWYKACVRDAMTAFASHGGGAVLLDTTMDLQAVLLCNDDSKFLGGRAVGVMGNSQPYIATVQTTRGLDGRA